MPRDSQYIWSRKHPHGKSRINKCYVHPRPGDVLFWERVVDGKLELIPNLNEYAIIPRDMYAKLTGEKYPPEDPNDPINRLARQFDEGKRNP